MNRWWQVQAQVLLMMRMLLHVHRPTHIPNLHQLKHQPSLQRVVGKKSKQHRKIFAYKKNATNKQINIILMFSIMCRLDIEDSDLENELIPTDNENPAGKKKNKR